MLPRVSLVALLLALNCLVRATQCTRSQERGREVAGDVASIVPGGWVLLRHTHANVTSESPPSLTSSPDDVAKDKLAKDEVDLEDADSAIELEKRGN